MNIDYIEYMKDMELGKPTSEDAFNKLEKDLQTALPGEYRQFMVEHNGAEGAIGEHNYLVIWPIEEIFELNEAYGVSEFTPGLIYFGSDGGGIAYAFDKRVIPFNIVKFPFDTIHIENSQYIANSFSEFIKKMHDE